MNHGNCIEQPIDQIQRKDGSGIAFLIIPSNWHRKDGTKLTGKFFH